MKIEQMTICTTGGGALPLSLWIYCTKPIEWRLPPQPKGLPPFVGVDGVQYALTPANIKRRS